MRLTTVILIASLMQVSASGFAQLITINRKNVQLKSVLKEIRRQSGFDFFYDGKIITDDQRIDINIRNVTIDEALHNTFEGLNFIYEIEGKKIAIKKKPAPSLIEKVKSFFNNINISGIITNENGIPLNGATIKVKDSKILTKTNTEGAFTLNGVDENAKLIISFMGYEDMEVKAIKNLGIIKLKLSNNPLDEIRVVAYGTESKRFSVSSISTVSADVIEKQPITNPLLALQGQAPGLTISATSGIPGSQVLVQVRGQNTLNLNSSVNAPKPYDQPLFIVDGVPFASQNQNVSQFASMVAAQRTSDGISPSIGISPFSNINPADIESISILKDADATSIYGTQGSNGVILITTKKGKAGATNFDVNVNTSVNSVGRPVQLLNTQQYLQLRRDAYAADGATPSSDPADYNNYAPDLTIFDQNKYTNWQKLIYGQNTTNTDVHASLSGGSANNTFIISTGFNRSTYNYPGDFADQRFTLHSNQRHISKNDRLSVSLTSDFGYGQNNSAGFGGARDAILSPNLPDLLDASGKLLWTYKGVDLTSQQFYASLLKPTKLHNYNFNAAFNISYKLLEGLTISANIGYNRNNTNENSIEPGVAQNPVYLSRQSNFSDITFQTINVEPQINYSKTIGKGILSAILGATYKKNTNSSRYVTGYGYSNDNFLGSVNGASSVQANDDASIYRYNAGFARINYIYDQRFIINLTGRRDGSSNFGPGRQFGNFGAVGAGWIFSEENIVKKLLPILSYGKISGSYGTSGSDGVQAYQYQALYKPIAFIPPFQGIAPSSPYNLYNPDYSWALKKSLNIGLDLGFFNSRLLLNATYYRNREGNQLVNYPLPIQSGISSVLGNLDAVVQNEGPEFSITSTNIQNKDFSWRTTFNLSFNRNKLISFPNLAFSSYSSAYAIGEPTSVVYGYKYKGVNPTTGLFEYYTKNGEVTSNPTYGLATEGGDQAAISDQQIKYMGGFGNTFSYKQFSLYIFCQFSSQNAPNYLAEVYGSSLIGLMYNQPLEVLNNYWKKPGDIAQLQRLGSSYSSISTSSALSFAQSSGVYRDVTYLRVKTASLSYKLPVSFINKVHIKGGSVFMNAQNLLTFTNIKVGDPEQPSTFSSFPMQRVLAFGLNLNF